MPEKERGRASITLPRISFIFLVISRWQNDINLVEKGFKKTSGFNG